MTFIFLFASDLIWQDCLAMFWKGRYIYLMVVYAIPTYKTAANIMLPETRHCLKMRDRGHDRPRPLADRLRIRN